MSTTKDFITQYGILIKGSNAVTSSTGQTNALQVNGGAAIAKNLIVGQDTDIYGKLSVNSTDVNTATNNLNALYVAGGVWIDKSLVVSETAIFQNEVYFIGTATYAYSTNTYVTDNLINIHAPAAGDYWTLDDGKDIGLTFQYYSTTGTTAGLILANDTKYLEWYDSGNEINGVFTASTYGTFKTGNILLVSDTSATNANSGALQVQGGVGISQDLYVDGTIFGTITTATNLEGGATGSIPYQLNPDQTTFLPIGGSDYILSTNGTIPEWRPVGELATGYSLTATHIRYGSPGQLIYQISTGTTGFVGPGNVGQILVSGGTSGPTYVNTGNIYVGRSILADTVNTVLRTNSGNHYITFVDSNNTTATAETVYTTSSVYAIPSSGQLWATQLRQTSDKVAIGSIAGYSLQGNNTVAIGSAAGQTSQSAQAVAIGSNAGNVTQGSNSVAIGYIAGYRTQGANSVAIGNAAAYNTQSSQAVAIGYQSGEQNQQSGAVSVGAVAGRDTQGSYAVAIGNNAGNTSQTSYAISIGYLAGQLTQGSSAVAVGYQAGRTTQGNSTVAVGHNAGQNTQTSGAVAIGYGSGNTNQGQNAIAIGYLAGFNSQTTGSIILNASGSTQDAGNAGFYVNPIRADSGSTDYLVYYNPITSEITTASAASISVGSAVQIETVQQTSTDTHYLTFVDSNNTTTTAENVYTTSSFTINPSNGNVTLSGNVDIYGRIVVGINNTGTATSAVLGGQNNHANGTNSFIGAGSGNKIAVLNNGNYGVGSVIVGGTTNVIAGSGSGFNNNFIGGGTGNTITYGVASTIVGGTTNVIQNSNKFYQFIGGGQSNTANGGYAVIAGGQNNVASGDYSQAGGFGGTTRGITGVRAWGYRRTTTGDSQTAEYLLSTATTTATISGTLTTDGLISTTTNQIIMPNNSAYGFKGMVTARDITNGWISVWEVKGGIRRGSNAALTTLIGTPVIDRITYDTTASSWSVNALADVTSGGLQLTATGSTTSNIIWLAQITTVEVA